MASIYEYESDSETSEDEIRPYMYEPEPVDQNYESYDETDEGSDVDQVYDNNSLRDGPNPVEWCECSRCTQTTWRESCCCRDFDLVTEVRGDLQCITEHEGFIGNCQNRFVIETCFYEFLESEGPPREGQQMHETYRYIAYRRFVRWIWKGLPKHCRKIIPSCAVAAIRQAFPDPEECYVGFQYPTLG